MKNILIYICGFISSLVICVSATLIYNAKDIEFKSINSDWNVNNVEDAIIELNDVIKDKKPFYLYNSGVFGMEFEGTITKQSNSFIINSGGTYSNNKITYTSEPIDFTYKNYIVYESSNYNRNYQNASIILTNIKPTSGVVDSNASVDGEKIFTNIKNDITILDVSNITGKLYLVLTNGRSSDTPSIKVNSIKIY